MGPVDSIKRVMGFAADESEFSSDIEFVSYNAFSLSDSAAMFAKCQRKVDGILFTGRAVYDSVVLCNNIDIPYTFVPHNENGLYELLATHDLSKYEYASVDSLDYETVKTCLRSSPIKEFSVYPLKDFKTEKDYLQTHRDNVRQHKNAVVFTAFSPIVKQLTKDGTPVFRIYTTKESVKSKLNELVLQIRNKKMDNSKIAVQIISLQMGTQRVTRTNSMENFLAFENQLLPYLKLISGAMFSYGRNEYIIFSTKGLIKKSEAQIEFFKIIKSSHFKISSGIGMGTTATLAEFNANKAIEYSLKENTSSFYIMYENQIIDGPILESGFVSCTTSNTDAAIGKIALATGLSANCIQKISSLISASDKNSFASDELSDLMNLSKRSSRRILKQLVDGGYASVSGTKSNVGAGRPQNIVKIELGL